MLILFIVQDAENYLVLMEQIAPQIVPKGVHFEQNPQRRAELVCQYAFSSYLHFVIWNRKDGWIWFYYDDRFDFLSFC